MKKLRPALLLSSSVVVMELPPSGERKRAALGFRDDVCGGTSHCLLHSETDNIPPAALPNLAMPPG